MADENDIPLNQSADTPADVDFTGIMARSQAHTIAVAGRNAESVGTLGKTMSLFGLNKSETQET